MKLTEPQKKRLGEKGWTTPSVRVQPLLSEGDPLKPDHVFFRVMLEEVWCRERMESEEKNGRWWWSKRRMERAAVDEELSDDRGDHSSLHL